MSEACPDEELLAGFVNHTLAPADQEQVERHIDGCASCRSLVAELLRADVPTDPGANDEGLLDTLASPGRTGSVLLTQGEKVGRFIVLDRLGLGGMGVVYAAHDPQLDRKVALKLLRADVAQGAPGEEARQRLLREAKAMARLDHPNVIGVHDVGTFGDEIFVAVEFVDGVTLRSWIESKPRSWREVLVTYLQAGKGLAAAHAAGLVHRDFKPDNALMGKDGRVRVTDFGLVRAVSSTSWPALTPAPVPVGANLPLEAALTRANAIMGTPAYMAPEQLDGRGADERSDQFSFSVALFEALYGIRPYPGRTIEEVRRQIKKGRPAFPVRSRVPFRVRRVLAKALSPSPFDRHASMEALLDELHRARRFVAQRQLAVVTAAVVAVIAAGVSLWPRSGGLCSGGEAKLAGVWDTERRAAVRAAVLSSGRADPEAVWTALERQLDDWATSFVAAHRDACEATRIRGEQSDAMLDARMFCLEGRLKEGKALVEVLSRPGAGADRAAEAATRLGGISTCSDIEALRLGLPPPGDASVRAEVEELQGVLAEVKAQRAAGDFVKARKLAADLDDRSRSVPYLPLRAEVLYQRGALEEGGGDWALAEKLLEDAIVAAESARHDELVAQATLNLMMLVGVRQGRLDEAMRLSRRVEAKVNRLGGSGELRGKLDNVLGVIALQQNRLDDAERSLLESVRNLERVLGPESTVLTSPLDNLASIYDRRGRSSEALRFRQRCFAINSKAYGAEHADTAMMELNLGVTLARLGRLEEAEKHERHAVEILRRAFPQGHAKLAHAMLTLADTLGRRHRWEEIQPLTHEAAEIVAKQLGPDHFRVAFARSMEGRALTGVGRAKEALALHADVAKALGGTPAVDGGAWIAANLEGEAEALLALGRAKEAAKSAERALAMREAVGTPIEVAGLKFLVARTLEKQDPARANTLATEARALYEQSGDAFGVGNVDAWRSR